MNVKALNKIKNLGIILATILLLFSLTSTIAFADNVKVIGNDIGLVVTPEDTNLFEEMNLNPGDCKEATITIENNYTSPFQLYLKINRLDEEPPLGDPDLLKQIIATISYKDTIIHQGPMSDFVTTPNGIDLGNYNPGDVQEIKIEICLPGLETGNEFMGLSAENQWIFTAQGEDEELIEEEEVPIGGGKIPEKDPEVDIEDEEIPLGGAKLPKTGTSPTALYYILGSGIALLGVTIIKKDE
jgi:LPXTG-motif cell wall-anchored protein